MKELDIEQYLRSNKPQVKNDPAFILETKRRIETVEAVKKEVDYQRSSGRMAVFVTLLVGLMVGVLVAIILLRFPIERLLISIEVWKSYIFTSIPCVAVGIIILTLSNKNSLPTFLSIVSSNKKNT
jgi:hypothetical protein